MEMPRTGRHEVTPVPDHTEGFRRVQREPTPVGVHETTSADDTRSFTKTASDADGDRVGVHRPAGDGTSDGFTKTATDTDDSGDQVGVHDVREASPMGLKRVAKLAQEAVPLQAVVGSGQVSLDPATGEALRKILLEQIDQVDSWLERAGRLARPAPLGANPVGDRMAGKFKGRAEGERVSFTAVMAAYRTVLQQTNDSVAAAIRNYREVDELHRTKFTGASGT